MIHSRSRYIVRLGDKDVDYNSNFRMVLVTRNPDPDLPPDARAIVNVANFTVTKSDLEGQLLGMTIQIVLINTKITPHTTSQNIPHLSLVFSAPEVSFSRG